MTPKEKAKELVDRYLKEVFSGDYLASPFAILCAKQCALIAVREIIKEPAYCDSGSTYYQEVEQELENS